MRISLVLAVIGELLLYFAAAFGPPLVLALLDRDMAAAGGFGVAMGICLALGSAAHTFFATKARLSFHRAESLAIVALGWLTVALIAAVPYAWVGFSFNDALFESMSGLTTTGATILTDFDSVGRSVFLWRGLTQWIGGIGVIALFVLVLPQLGIAGRQLFFAEASSVSGRPAPQVRSTAARLLALYTALTAILVAALIVTGMPSFDAVCNALSTLSTGGFSPNGASIGGYDNPAAEWVMIPFMLAAGSSFTLLYRAITGNPKALALDTEARTFIGMWVLLSVLVAIVRADAMDLDSIRHSLFQVASLLSSTGFASTDYDQWSYPVKALLLVALLTNGCAGSAGGGPKVVRLIIFARYLTQTITRTIHPNAILPYKYGKQVISGRIMRSVITLVVLYFLGYVVVGLIVVMLGSDFETGFVAAIVTLGGIGPGFGPIGPMGSFAHLSEPTKLVLTGAMWIGRLEIVTVLALLHPDCWRNFRWRDRPRSR